MSQTPACERLPEKRFQWTGFVCEASVSTTGARSAGCQPVTGQRRQAAYATNWFHA